ncbi:MAG TPA: GNAT family N-acetyltransferase [Aggregatilinea sp.]|uniref:GNAT family N-acetyltransferase n=1 Tax=Aggregatilinea sp. TaxID=2806333 RepID=UPI002CC7C139|nr:GNAT family N-acetyltransferase [Aggregatilinea sp.]HML23047.1 GNAT family N-acetyltransferase [Aggregatilinea sp.]
MDWQDRYEPRRAPDPVLRLMTADDIPAAGDVLHSVGWRTDVRRWERILYWEPEGCFALDEPGRGVIGTVSTTTYGTALGWIGMMVIAGDRQKRGYGRQLMRAALDYLIARGTERIMLDASDMGRPLYESLNFRPLHKHYRWEGRASTYLGPRARRLEAGDLDAVIALDTQLYGIPRPHILTKLLEDYPGMAWVDETRGGLQGFLMARQEVGHGVYLGPWMALTAESGERLLRTALEQFQGQDVTMNVSDVNGRAMQIAERHNLRRGSGTQRMIYGDAFPVQGEPLAELSITSYATG